MRRGVLRVGGLAAGTIERIATIDTPWARCSTTASDVSAIGGASIPGFVAATDASDRSASSQQNASDTPGAEPGAVATVAFESCCIE